MTEELEKKLNELLGLKTQLEEATEEQRKINTSLVLKQYAKEIRFNFIRFCVVAVFGWGMVMFGTIVYVQHTDVLNFEWSMIIIAGLLLILFGKVLWLVRQSKLTILQEMKESELRILEALKR